MLKAVEVIEKSIERNERGKGRKFERSRVAAYCRVSRDTEEQLGSYKSQVEHYTKLVTSNPEWELVDIYADEAISGTQVGKRTEFQRLINDAIEGKVDLIITKSISRFARNTLDTLKYVRMLKEKNIAVQFEKEKINTLTMNGETLLTILSSLAQQESESTSANVKLGLKMKMKRGELVGFQSCLGYDYDTVTKMLSVNEKEAEIVRYIFNRYADGVGCRVIGRELEQLGFKTKKGFATWGDSSVKGILRNEKYVGDILMGKTFTVDPISHRRLSNMGEEEQYYIKNHHEPIVSRELFDKVQETSKKRAVSRETGRSSKYSQRYTFSSTLYCGCCGGLFTRRSWNSNSKHKKRVWQCVVSTKKGRKHCPDSKAADEKIVEDAFVKTFQLICHNNKEIVNDFIQNVSETLKDSNYLKEFERGKKKLEELEDKKSKLIDLKLEGLIDKESFEKKGHDLDFKMESIRTTLIELKQLLSNEGELDRRLKEFRKIFEGDELLTKFDPQVFKSSIEKVIIGEIDEHGNKDPYKITFIFKTGLKKEARNEVKKRGRKKRAIESEKKYVPNEDTTSKEYVPDKDTTHVECVVLMTRKAG